MRVKIHDIDNQDTYCMASIEAARDDTDRSIYQAVLYHKAVITMGHFIGEPAPEKPSEAKYIGTEGAQI